MKKSLLSLFTVGLMSGALFAEGTDSNTPSATTVTPAPVVKVEKSATPPAQKKHHHKKSAQKVGKKAETSTAPMGR